MIVYVPVERPRRGIWPAIINFLKLVLTIAFSYSFQNCTRGRSRVWACFMFLRLLSSLFLLLFFSFPHLTTCSFFSSLLFFARDLLSDISCLDFGRPFIEYHIIYARLFESSA